MKILDALPQAMQSQILAIKESKDLKALPVEELINFLFTHEMKLKKLNDQELQYKRKKSLNFKTSKENSN